MKTVEIDAKDLHYTPLNQQIRKAVSEGAKEITVINIMGQRFIADGLKGRGIAAPPWGRRWGPRDVHERAGCYVVWQCRPCTW